MKIIRDNDLIRQAIRQYDIDSFFDNMDMDFFLVNYEKGDFLRTPLHKTYWMQIVLSGIVSIYYIREDGTMYSVAHGSGHSRIGEFESFVQKEVPLYSEACSDVTTLAFSVTRYREQLLNDRRFMRSTIQNMAETIYSLTEHSIQIPPLKERVLTHIQYNCTDHILKGVEANAFLLHCSPRQLQRVLNELEKEGTLKKLGKGTFCLQ